MDRRNPECHPLFTLEEVLSWQPGNDKFCVATIPIRPRKENDNPKLLVCHDFRGGYLEDRLVQGCGRPSAYRFYHWQYVDIFVYFSHYFVTIPPPAWTNSGHRHGVKVLGTVITEWDDGKARCEEFLKSEESYKQFANLLVQIAKYYGFDGWLVNIENKIETEELVKNLTSFVKYLTEEQHKHIPGSEVIWYDSVISTGELDWQNALNDKNRQFFDGCDGIFLNYCWKDEHLESSKTMAVEAKRPNDVYVGIDVFGRGCLGDGGFNTREALQAVRKHKLSAAIFAPGWVLETQGVENFTHNENKFWRLLEDLLYPCSYTTLPINTTFCQGFGERFFDNGIPVGNPWWNMNVQQLQPTFTQGQFSKNQSEQTQTDSQVAESNLNQSAQLNSETSSKALDQSTKLPAPAVLMGWKQSNQAIVEMEEEPVMDICTDDAFIGGSCLRLEADVVHSKFPKYNLFSLDVELKQYTSVYVSVTYKILQDPDCDIFLELHLQHDDQSIVLVLLPYPDGDKPVPTFGKDKACMYVHGMSKSSLPRLLALSCPQLNNTRWKTKLFPVYSLYLKFCKLTLIKVGLTTTDPQPKKCIALLGDLKILPGDDLMESFPRTEFGSVEIDTSTSYPLIDVTQNNFKPDKDDNHKNPVSVEWGVDSYGNPINIPYSELDKMRVSSHTLREFRPGIGGQLCEVLYQLITSLDCFTVHWKVDTPDIIDHYRVYQIKIDSGVAKLLGHVTEPNFKVTWFEIPDFEKDEVIHHFKFVIRPVLKNGIAVPLDYNYCQLFHIASKKDSVQLVKDSCTGMQAANENDSNSTSDKVDDSDKQQCDGDNCVAECNKEIETEKTQSGDNIENLTKQLHISDE